MAVTGRPAGSMPAHAVAGLTFRRAEPADVDAAAPLIYSSGPASFDYVFGDGTAGRALAFLRRAFVDSEGEFGHRCHTVAVRAGEVVGIGAAFDGAATLRFMRAAVRQILRSYGPAGAAVIIRGLRVERIIRPPTAREYYICHLGVREPLRGQGVGRALVGELLRAATPGHHRIASLDVAVGNPRAEALYARLGFVTQALRVSNLRRSVATVPDHRRMSLALAG